MRIVSRGSATAIPGPPAAARRPVPAAVPEERAAGVWWRQPSCWLPVAASALFSLVFILRTAFTVDGTLYFTLFDDAMVSMRYARNLAAGHGLVWNAGQQPVEGYTNLLWTLWLAVLHLLPVPEAKTALLVMLSGAIVLAGNVLLVGRIAAHLARGDRRVAVLAMWFTALYYPLVYWTLRGMEVGLIALLLSVAILLALRLRATFRLRDVRLLAAVMALGVLTRTDAAIPCAVIAAFAIYTAPRAQRRRTALALGGAVAGVLALNTLFRLVYYGYPLPNTYYLKVQGIALTTRLARGAWWFAEDLVTHLYAPLALAAGYLAARRRAAHPGAYLLALVFLGQGAYSVYVGGDAWEWMLYANRYVTPVVPQLLVLSALGISALTGTAGPALRRVPRALAYVFQAVFLIGLPGWILVTSLGFWSNDPEAFRTILGVTLPGRVRTVAAALLSLVFLTWPRRPGGAAPIGRRRSPATPLAPHTALVLAILLLLAVNGDPVGHWLTHNAYYADADAAMAHCGLAVRAATAPEATIAVVWAGAIPYFAQRPAVDLLGKSDHVVATADSRRVDFMAGQIAGFVPGHTKWDYAYSIGQLRPDVIVQLWERTADGSPAGIPAIASYGYERLGDAFFVRNDSHLVDRDRLSSTTLPACT